MAIRGPDPETVKWLNLLRESKSFVIVEAADGEVTITSRRSIPAESGMNWVSGSVTTAHGREYEAVLIVDTDAGGELCGGYIWNGAWAHLEDLARVSEAKRHEVYPFDYSLNVPLEADHSH